MPVTHTTYFLGQRLALTLPLRCSYWIAERLADLQYARGKSDRAAIESNLAPIVSDPSQRQRMTREIFRNFAKYLVDFLRFPRVTNHFVQRYVRVEGLAHVTSTLERHGGVISVTAHLGNWELAGAVTAQLGFPVAAIALNHQDRRINEFFITQRRSKGVTAIAPGFALRQCQRLLSQRYVVALLGDRNYTARGVRCTLLGRMIEVPRGPAWLSVRTGIPIVPGFLTREPGRAPYALRFEPPIVPPRAIAHEETAIEQLSQQCVVVIEQYLRRYPTQWFMFRPFDVPEPSACAQPVAL